MFITLLSKFEIFIGTLLTTKNNPLTMDYKTLYEAELTKNKKLKEFRDSVIDTLKCDDDLKDSEIIDMIDEMENDWDPNHYQELKEHYEKTMSKEHGWGNAIMAKKYEEKDLENEKLEVANASLKESNDQLEYEVLDSRESYNLQRMSGNFWYKGVEFTDPETGETLSHRDYFDRLKECYDKSIKLEKLNCQLDKLKQKIIENCRGWEGQDLAGLCFTMVVGSEQLSP